MSIFDLKTSVEELSSANQGTSRMEYDQHPPTRSVVNDAFHNGAIHFRFQTSGQKWWVPSRSYIRMRLRIANGDGTAQLTNAANIAPNMGLCATMFQNAEFRINDKTISRISDFMPQIDALENRLTKSRSYLKGVGNALNLWDEDFKIRQSMITSDGLLQEDILSDDLTTTNRADMGFDAAGGAAAERNSWAFTAASGALVYAQGTDGNGLSAALASAAYPVGSFFTYSFIQGAAAGDGRVGIPCKVLTNDGAGSLTVERNLSANVAADGRNNFVRGVYNLGASNKARNVQYLELIWQPPLSIFKIGHALPSGRYELVLNPQTASVYQKNAIESILADKTPGAGNDFSVNVENMYLYCNTVEGPRADDITYLLDLEQTNCDSDNVPSANFAQRNFDVSPSTYALTVAYQDKRVGSDTQFSQSKFISYDADSTTAGQELKLNRFFINYAGQNLPAPDADPEYVPASAKDYTTQRYADTQLYSGAMFDTGGAESLHEWQKRGAYYYFAWPRDGTDRSTRVSVHQGFQNLTQQQKDNMRILLFSHSKQVARVRVQDGRVVDVQLEDA